MYRPILIALALAAPCTEPRTAAVDSTLELAPCTAAETFGVRADGNPNTNRAALVAAQTTCAGGALHIGPGVIDIAVVSALRGGVSVPLQAGLLCERNTTIRFVGDAVGRDWVGLYVGPGSTNIEIAHCAFDGSGVVGVNEHSPLVQLRGPVANVRIHHNTWSYPALPGTDRGDCVQSIGYGPAQLVTDLRVDHNVFTECARVGIAFHSGTLGELDHNRFVVGGRAADMDGEGSGGSSLRIHHNISSSGPSGSAYALNVQGDATHEIHDNVFSKAISLAGCAYCAVHDNRVTFALGSSVPVLSVSKLSPNYQDHDNVYERAASAAPGTLVVVAEKITAPSDVVFEDDVMAQRSNARAIVQSLGISGLAIRHSRLTYAGPTPFPAWDAPGLTSRTTRIELDHTTVEGVVAPLMAISGSYGGTGSVSVTDVVAPATLGCANARAAAQILGPITYLRNDAPPLPSTCAP